MIIKRTEQPELFHELRSVRNGSNTNQIHVDKGIIYSDTNKSTTIIRIDTDIPPGIYLIKSNGRNWLELTPLNTPMPPMPAPTPAGTNWHQFHVKIYDTTLNLETFIERETGINNTRKQVSPLLILHRGQEVNLLWRKGEVFLYCGNMTIHLKPYSPPTKAHKVLLTGLSKPDHKILKAMAKARYTSVNALILQEVRALLTNNVKIGQ